MPAASGLAPSDLDLNKPRRNHPSPRLSAMSRLALALTIMSCLTGALAKADELYCGFGCPTAPATFTFTEYFDYPFLSGTPEAQWVITLDTYSIVDGGGRHYLSLTPTSVNQDFVNDGISLFDDSIPQNGQNQELFNPPFLQFGNSTGTDLYVQATPASFNVGLIDYYAQAEVAFQPPNPNLLFCDLPCSSSLSVDSALSVGNPNAIYLNNSVNGTDVYHATSDTLVMGTTEASTPEPRTVWLCAISMVAIAFARVRRRRFRPNGSTRVSFALTSRTNAPRPQRKKPRNPSSGTLASRS